MAISAHYLGLYSGGRGTLTGDICSLSLTHSLSLSLSLSLTHTHTHTHTFPPPSLPSLSLYHFHFFMQKIEQHWVWSGNEAVSDVLRNWSRLVVAKSTTVHVFVLTFECQVLLTAVCLYVFNFRLVPRTKLISEEIWSTFGEIPNEITLPLPLC